MTRIQKKAKERPSNTSPLRRVIKTDNTFADYASLRASTGIIIPEVRKVLLDRKKTESGVVSRRKLYPSEMSRADWCPRATYYRLSGMPDAPSSYSLQLENVFAQGNAIHEKWQNWLAQTGKLWGDWKCSRCSEYVKDSLKPDENFGGSCVGTSWVNLHNYITDINITKDEVFAHDWKYKEVTLKSTSLPLSGHADGGLVGHDALVELKSISAGSFRFEAPKLFESHTHTLDGRKVTDIDSMWKDFHSPLTPHIKQGNLYLFMAKEMKLPFDRISFLYENKANNQVKEFIVPYSYSIIEPIIETALKVTEALADHTAPPCPRGGCSSCKFYDKQEDK